MPPAIADLRTFPAGTSTGGTTATVAALNQIFLHKKGNGINLHLLHMDTKPVLFVVLSAPLTHSFSYWLYQSR